MARRGPGEGSIYRESRTRQTMDGPVTIDYWVATVEAEPDPLTGNRRVIKVRALTKAAALEKIRQRRQQVESGIRDEPNLTVGCFLADWANVVLPPRVGPATVANYVAVMNGHLIPGLGKIKLRDLTPEHVDRFLKAKADTGLSKRYVGRMRSVLTDALNHAERRQLVSRNASRLSIMPHCVAATPARSLTAEEAEGFVAEATALDVDGLPKHRLGVMFVLMLTLGLRPGEATGLQWDDLNLDVGSLAITGSIKRIPRVNGGYELLRGEVKRSTAGLRTLVLPTDIIPLLLAHRSRQAVERLAVGPVWVDCGLIFPNEIGQPIDPSNARRAISKLASGAGIAGAVNPYTARHSAASLRLDAGQPLDQVADLLGDNPRTVLLHYRHRVRPLVRVAADTPLAAALARASGTER